VGEARRRARAGAGLEELTCARRAVRPECDGGCGDARDYAGDASRGCASGRVRRARGMVGAVNEGEVPRVGRAGLGRGLSSRRAGHENAGM
jgi:hypothetical protein